MLEFLTSFYLGIQSAPIIPPNISVLAQAQTSNSTSAAEIFRNAYENRYTWDSQFPGYTATVKVKQGNSNYEGKIAVNSDLTVKVTGIPKEEVQSSVKNQLRMIVVHRRRVPFETEHKNSTFELGTPARNGAVKIIEQGKTNAQYEVFQNELRQVNRLLGDVAVTVNVVASQKTPLGYLATHYKTILKQPGNQQVIGEMDQKDSYRKFGNYYLLTRQELQETDFNQKQQNTTILDFKDIHLNQPD